MNFSKNFTTLAISAIAVTGLAFGSSIVSAPMANADVNVKIVVDSTNVLSIPKLSSIEWVNGAPRISGSTTYTTKLNFVDAPADDTITYDWGNGKSFFDNGVEIVKTASNSGKSSINLDYEAHVSNLDFIGLNESNRITIKVPASLTPGKYRLNVPVTVSRMDNDGSKTPLKIVNVSSDYTVNANVSNSKAATKLSVSGKKGSKKKLSVYMTTMAYMANAKVTAYFVTGGHTTKVGSGTVNSIGVAKFSTSKGKIRKAGKLYLSVGSVAYAGGFTTGSKKIK